MGNEVTGAPFCSSCGRGATLVNVGIGIRTYVLSHARHVFDAWVHVLHAHAPHAQGGLRADHALLEGMITIAPQAQHVRDVLRGVMLVPSEGLCAAGVPPVCTIMMLVAALPAPIVWAVGSMVKEQCALRVQLVPTTTTKVHARRVCRARQPSRLALESARFNMYHDAVSGSRDGLFVCSPSEGWRASDDGGGGTCHAM